MSTICIGWWKREWKKTMSLMSEKGSAQRYTGHERHTVKQKGLSLKATTSKRRWGGKIKLQCHAGTKL